MQAAPGGFEGLEILLIEYRAHLDCHSLIENSTKLTLLRRGVGDDVASDSVGHDRGDIDFFRAGLGDVAGGNGPEAARPVILPSARRRPAAWGLGGSSGP